MKYSKTSFVYRVASLTSFDEPITDDASLFSGFMLSVTLGALAAGLVYCLSAIVAITYLHHVGDTSTNGLALLPYQILMICWALAARQAFMFFTPRLKDFVVRQALK
ncbi:MAG: hypothetical protein ABJN42_09955 [Roseibium sp.]|uniref:hypothetical protein n=1 Tax=Roseibium sp. TaxID=1936156 RepID=UPI0032983E46